MTDHDLRAAVYSTKNREAELLLSKHNDYGPRNIAAAPGGPLRGLAVRMHDKVERIDHLLSKGVDPQHESMADSFRDLANYGTIGQLVISGEWPTADGGFDVEVLRAENARLRAELVALRACLDVLYDWADAELV